MSKPSALVGLVSYGSDEESDDGAPPRPAEPPRSAPTAAASAERSAAIHPAPIPHCPWSACYDENSGFTYYWNQQTNAVTWEAPPEYLLALKLAQQQLHTSGTAEVSAEEWQLYQQALAEKQKSQRKALAKAAIIGKSVKKDDKPAPKAKDKKYRNSKRSFSDDEDMKIEPITSYYQSDSDSNDEPESPAKSSVKPSPPPPKPVINPPLPKNPHKKQKTKSTPVEYGPSLPPNLEYTVPIGPELPPNLVVRPELPPTTVGPQLPSPVVERTTESPKIEVLKDEAKSTPKSNENEDSEDENLLLMKLKDKAKLLEKLGGELPSDVQKIIHDETKNVDENSKDIDDLLEEIEKKELPKVVKTKVKIDMFGDDSNYKSTESSARNSPKSRDKTPPKEEFKPLFPSSKAIDETEKPVSLFPSAAKIEENGVDAKPKPEPPAETKPKENVYLMKPDEPIEKVARKKLRISNSVLPERKKTEMPAYTTKYSQFIEGFSSERTGLGFTKEEEEDGNTPKNTVSYGNGLTFTKGEVLNEDKKDEILDDLADLVAAKLKYLNEVQPCVVPPLQEMMIQMQTLSLAYVTGALSLAYWRRWCEAGAAALASHEAAATPAGWAAVFMRSEGRYRYTRESDGLSQWEYPAASNTDMDISTTPPHPGIPAHKEEAPPLPPLPPSPPPPLPARAATPPPPAWEPPAPAPATVAWEPPPPGCDDAPPPPLPPDPPKPPKQEIGDELMSFYNDIAELEKCQPPLPPPSQPTPGSHAASPEPPPPPSLTANDVREEKKEKSKKKTKPPLPPSQPTPGSHAASPEPPPPPSLAAADVREEKKEKSKKKTKVKISSSIGMKHKSVSTLVAKWQQVAEQINSD